MRKDISQAAITFAKDVRHISRETLERLRVVSGTVFFPKLDRKSEAMFFQYFMDGEEVNWKAAAFPEKAFTSKPGGELIFYNLDEVLKARSERIYITEGEWDVAALIESGIPVEQCLSVPNGAREHAQEGERPSGYDYVVDALKLGLARVREFVWCGDRDDAGHSLRQDMVRLLGRARFRYVDWPDGCKDANDFLRTDGKQAVLDLVTDGSLPWPVDGLYRLSEIPDPAPIKTWRIQIPEWEDKIRLAAGTLSVVTGHPGHGKTALWSQLWFNIVRHYDLTACIASFETRPKPYVRRQLRTLFSGKLEWQMSDGECTKADAWIDAHYLWISHPEQRPTLEWFLDTAEVAVIRNGAKIVQIDPWNRLESQRSRDETETEYIGRCLTSLYVFAQEMGPHLQIIAHPGKMESMRRGRAPELEDIAGSKHWDNRVDQGFVVHRPHLYDGEEQRLDGELHHKKSRFVEELGHPCKLQMRYDPKNGKFIPVDKEAAKNEQ